MPFSPATLVEKPYNRCVTCPNLGVRCDGPNPLALTPERRIEWAKLRKDYKGFTNAYIAEKAGLAELTVTRFFAGTMKDMRVSTLEAIYRVLVDGTWGQYPCPLDFSNEDDDTDCVSCKKLQDAIAAERQKIDHLKKQVAFAESQMLEKDAQIRSKDERLQERANFIYRKDRVITILSVLLSISVLLIIAALLIDISNPNIGFFWVERMAALVG